MELMGIKEELVWNPGLAGHLSKTQNVLAPFLHLLWSVAV